MGGRQSRLGPIHIHPAGGGGQGLASGLPHSWQLCLCPNNVPSVWRPRPGTHSLVFLVPHPGCPDPGAPCHFPPAKRHPLGILGQRGQSCLQPEKNETHTASSPMPTRCQPPGSSPCAPRDPCEGPGGGHGAPPTPEGQPLHGQPHPPQPWRLAGGEPWPSMAAFVQAGGRGEAGQGSTPCQETSPYTPNSPPPGTGKVVPGTIWCQRRGPWPRGCTGADGHPAFSLGWG